MSHHCPRDQIRTEVRHSTWGGSPQPPCQVCCVVVGLVEDARLRRRRRGGCALGVVAVRLLVDVNGGLALQDVQDNVEALGLWSWNESALMIRSEVRGEELRRERLDEPDELLGALAAVCGREPPIFST